MAVALAGEVLLPIYKKEAVHEFDPLLFSTHRPEPLFQRGGSSERILSCPANASLKTRPRTWGRFFVLARRVRSYLAMDQETDNQFFSGVKAHVVFGLSGTAEAVPSPKAIRR
jgi:hypothetical protein